MRSRICHLWLILETNMKQLQHESILPHGTNFRSDCSHLTGPAESSATTRRSSYYSVCPCMITLHLNDARLFN